MPHYTDAALNLRYSDGGRPSASSARKARVRVSRRILVGLVHVFGWWAWRRLGTLMERKRWAELPEDDGRRRFHTAVRAGERLYRVLALANAVVFLRHGRFRSLGDRLLGLSLVPISTSVRRSVSFDFMNRQLVWSGFTELMVFLVPFVDLASRGARSASARISAQLASFAHGSALPPDDAAPGVLASGACRICDTDAPDMAHRTDCCNALFCYHCLRVRLVLSRVCPACAAPVPSIRHDGVERVPPPA